MLCLRALGLLSLPLIGILLASLPACVTGTFRALCFAFLATCCEAWLTILVVPKSDLFAASTWLSGSRSSIVALASLTCTEPSTSRITRAVLVAGAREACKALLTVGKAPWAASGLVFTTLRWNFTHSTPVSSLPAALRASLS